MSERWVIEGGAFGPRMTLQGPWSSAAESALRESHVRELVLNYALGWKGKGLGFLLGLTDCLEAFEVLDWNIEDVSEVNELVLLKKLSIQTFCKTELAFERWPFLEACSLEWRSKASSLLSHRGVKSLVVSNYTGRKLSEFSGMSKLRKLTLKGVRRLESCVEVGGLAELRRLEIALATRLASLRGVEDLTGLEHLQIEACRRIADITPLCSLERLESLHLIDCGDIASLGPIAGLRKLERVLFYGSTNIVDGDLSALEKMPRLREVAFSERAHYSHTEADLRAG